MNILTATIQEVINYIDNLPGGVKGEVFDEVLKNSTFEEHYILVKALFEGFDHKGDRI